jgi:hypothetical protein
VGGRDYGMQRPASRSRSAAERPLPGAVLLPSANTSAPPPTASSTTMTDLGFRTSQPRRSQRRHDDSWRKFGAPARIKLRTRMLLISRYKSSFTLLGSIAALWPETVEAAVPAGHRRAFRWLRGLATTFTEHVQNGGAIRPSVDAGRVKVQGAPLPRFLAQFITGCSACSESESYLLIPSSADRQVVASNARQRSLFAIPRFESCHPSQPVRSLRRGFQVWENRRPSRGLG